MALAYTPGIAASTPAFPPVVQKFPLVGRDSLVRLRASSVPSGLSTDAISSYQMLPFRYASKFQSWIAGA
jgi:hypothetical protein